MARRAQFGQAPRVQPSLSSTLISIAHEMQAQRDRNIMDAWKNGGKFEGQDATDEAVLAYWKARMENLDPNDPNYNAYANQVLQLQYAVEQSKADLAHLQGKMSDTQYAQFFLKWAKKVPKNSEFWRVLQKDAAQLMEQSKQHRSVSADQAKLESYNKYVATKQDDIDLGNALTDAINKISKETGLPVTSNGDLLLDLLSQDYAAHPSEYRALQDSLKGTGFDGTFTPGFVSASFNSARLAYKDVATRANKDGYASAYDSAAKGQSAMSDWGQNLEVWPVATSYEHAYDKWQSVLRDPKSSWKERDAANKEFSATATTLAQDPNIDAGSRVMLLADADRAIGADGGDAPSFGQAMLGHEGVTPEMQSQSLFYATAVETMAQNPGAFMYAPVDAKGAFDPTGAGAIGIVPTGSIPADAVMVPMPGMGSDGMMVAIKPVSILMADPNDPKAAPIPIGKSITYSVGGKSVTLYNYNDGEGIGHWSVTSPLADGVTTKTDKNGDLVVTPAGYTNPMTAAQAFDAKNGTDIASQMKNFIGQDGQPIPGSTASATKDIRDKDGKVIGRMDVKWDGARFNATQTSYSYDAMGQRVESGTTSIPFGVNTPEDLQKATIAGSRLQAGDIPGVTYDSPAAAGIAAAGTLMSDTQVQTLLNDPTFQQSFMVQTMASYGTQDPLDPRVQKAWGDIAEAAKPRKTVMQPWQIGTNPWNRNGLSLPGAVVQDDRGTETFTIGFGGQTIKVPDVPSYLKAADPNLLSDYYGKQFRQSAGQAASFPLQVAPPATAPTTLSVPKVTQVTGVNTMSVNPPKATGVSTPTPTVAPTPVPSPGVSTGSINPPGAPSPSPKPR